MKKILIFGLCFVFWACSDSTHTHNNESDAVLLVDSYPQVVEIIEKRAAGDMQGATQVQDSILKAGVGQNIIDDNISLITRAFTSGYELVLPNDIKGKLDDYIIISTLPRGIYNLGLIPTSKHFEFALSPSLNADGSEWNWEADALSRPQEEFIQLLGDDKNAKILFYDGGEHIYAPMGSAHIAIMWAKHLGYTQLYRLVGGFSAWKDLGLPVTTEKPHCCEM